MRLQLETNRFYLARYYSEAVEAAGGLPIHIPLIPKADFVNGVMNSLDGLLLPGSDSDMDPLRYGREPHPKLGSVHPEKDETDLLVNLTNNGWFGESAAQWQHAASARFRAVENGLPLLRCSNNGLTCWVDAQGRLRQIFQDKTGSVYGAGFVTAKIPRPPGERRAPTFYHEHGDWFGWGCLVLSSIACMVRFLARKSGSSD